MTELNPNPPVELNPDLDLTGVRERFDKTGRAQIKDVFHRDTADRFYACLLEETPWVLAFNEGTTPRFLTREMMDRLPEQQKAGLMQELFIRASTQFQYAYSDFPVSGTINKPDQPELYSHKVLSYLNGKAFQDFIAGVTGLEGKFAVDGHTTCFQSGHFLTMHDDSDTDGRRELAYVINMTPVWRSDWGGTLLFFDEDYNITESLVPSYNTLNIFSVPQGHAVSFVAPFAAEKRFAMTGWFHREA